MNASASALKGSHGAPSVLYLPALIAVTAMPSWSRFRDQSSCSMYTPIEPTSPLGVTTTSSAAEPSQ